MKMLVIGHSVVDRIKAGEKITVKPGGIFYTSIGLLNFMDSDDEIFLLSKMDKNNYGLFEEVYRNFNLSLLEWVDKISTVELIIHEDEERWEHYNSVPEALNLPPDLDCKLYDGILINMINGLDISHDDLSLIRKNFDGPVYFDVHTLSRGIGKNNHRYFRKIPESEKWFANIDIVQANEHEILTFCGSEDEKYIAEWTLNLGVGHLIVTKGSKGVVLYSPGDNGKIIKTEFEAESFNSVNKVGCGDIFGAAAFYNYLAGLDFVQSIKLANRAAGFVTSFTEIEQFYSLKEKMDIVDD